MRLCKINVSHFLLQRLRNFNHAIIATIPGQRHYNKMTQAQQQALLEEIHRSPEAFGKLFDAYYRPIFSYVFRRTGNYDTSSDIVAETFLKAFLNIGRFQWRGVSLSSWLYRIATNETNYYFRKKKYQPQQLSQLKDFNVINLHRPHEERDEIERQLRNMHAFETVRVQLATLDVKYQEVIALRYFEEKDNRAISEILGKPEGTIKSLLSRGLEKLRLLVNTATKNDI